MKKNIVVAVTGASGAIYAVRLIKALCAGHARTHLVISPHGRQLLADELDISDPTAETLVGSAPAEYLTIYSYRDVGARLASGSFITDGMIICPCSGNTLCRGLFRTQIEHCE